MVAETSLSHLGRSLCWGRRGRPGLEPHGNQRRRTRRAAPDGVGRSLPVHAADFRGWERPCGGSRAPRLLCRTQSRGQAACEGMENAVFVQVLPT